MQKAFYLFWIAACIGLTACSPEKPKDADFRAVWVATVHQIDWPSPQQYDPDSQRQAFIELLDYYAEHHFNAIIVQIRTAGDAFYPTQLAPWSRFLTGEEGKSPEPYFDPVQFMVEACHERGLEFHAWMNPYRATTSLDTNRLSAQHVFFQHPEWMIKYGNKYFLNPGLPEVRKHLVDVVTEVCKRYDIDGMHFDDYFYPYKIEGEHFNDSIAYERFGKMQFATVDDWRRDNVNQLIQALHVSIQQTAPGISFGISPFGVWRNKDKDRRGSKTSSLQTNYDDLYADCLHWMEQGWIDYIAPQIYFSMDHRKVSYRELVQWWAKQGKQYGTQVYPGLAAYKVNNNGDSAWYDTRQLLYQLEKNKEYYAVRGAITFSAKSLLDKPQVMQGIKQEYFTPKRLPFMRGKRQDISPGIVELTAGLDSIRVTFNNTDSLELVSILLFTPNEKDQFINLDQRIWANNTNTYTFELPEKSNTIAFAYLDKQRRLSLKTNPIAIQPRIQ